MLLLVFFIPCFQECFRHFTPVRIRTGLNILDCIGAVILLDHDKWLPYPTHFAKIIQYPDP